MRISTNERDSGYKTLHSWGGPSRAIKVLLDGVELRDVETADEELGEVRVALRDAQDKLYAVGDEVAHEWRRGKVEIQMPGRDA